MVDERREVNVLSSLEQDDPPPSVLTAIGLTFLTNCELLMAQLSGRMGARRDAAFNSSNGAKRNSRRAEDEQSILELPSLRLGALSLLACQCYEFHQRRR